MSSRIAGALAAAWVLLALPAAAAPIDAHVTGCVGDVCTAAPDGGPVAVDPLGFTLDTFWGPDFIELTEDPGGGHWNMQVLFQFTGTHTGLEHFGAISLLDAAGLPIGALNVQFDDLNPLQRANYEIFGPLDQPFAVYGFQLGLSDGSGVDTMDWVSVSFFPASATVPEPSVIVLVALVAVAIVGRQIMRLRRTRSARLH
ncbi:MAG TPA: hypothetical protein VGQ37_23590 [Vicinamibacterales bacterium]|jgi:hypothetical protein|nr:hypothetical protein [Vicinamibacterales bacterium]